MEDYKEQIKELLLREFATQGSRQLAMTTTQVTRMVKGVIPKEPITEHEVYEVLKEINYPMHLKTVFMKDEEDKDTDLIDFQIFVWLLSPIHPLK